jgi:two-component system KDP operon response regulator KdpE
MEHKSLRVLIIEDDQGIVDTVSAMFHLNWPDIELISAHTGEDGLTLVKTGNPDLVILDLGLPDTDGFHVLRGIRRFSEVPIIICTVRGDRADMIKGADLGADDYVVKPFQSSVLKQRVMTQLRKSSYR